MIFLNVFSIKSAIKTAVDKVKRNKKGPDEIAIKNANNFIKVINEILNSDEMFS